LQYCLVTAVELYLTHFWLRYAKQLSQLTFIAPLTAVKKRKKILSHFRQLPLCTLTKKILLLLLDFFLETKLNLFWKTKFNFVSNLTLLATDQQYI